MSEIDRLRSLAGVKWSRYPEPVLPAWVADMDFDPAAAIKDGIRELVDRGDLGYAGFGSAPVVDAWCDWIEAHQRWRPPEDEVWQFTGSLHALEAIMALHTEPGDGVVIFTPVYWPFRAAIVESGRRVVDVPLVDRSWALDAERFEAMVDPGTRVVLLCQPHNPVGRVFDEAEITALAEVAERHDLLVISDEIWADLCHAPNEHLPAWRASEQLRGRLVTIGSASKAFNLAGLRLALAHVGSPEIRRTLSAMSTHQLGSPSTLSVAATIAAWTKAEDWLVGIRAELTARRDRLAARLAAEVPAVGFTLPQATYLAWLDFTATDLGTDPARVLYKQGDIALEEGSKYGTQGAGYARLNFATTEPILDELVDRLVGVVHGRRAR